MRVNPNYTDDLVSAISNTQQQVATAIEQLSSGKRVSTPSDDPAAAAAYVLNRAQANKDDAYQQSISTLQAQLKTADSALSTVVTQVTRAITLGTEGANGPISDSNRQQIAQDVQGVLEGVLQVANTQFQGVYLFAGTDVTTKPFVYNEGAGTITYYGNPLTSSVAVSDGQTIDTNVPGDELFQNSGGNLLGSLQSLINALKSGDTSAIGNATTDVSTALSKFSTVRVFYGNTVNQLDAAESYLKQDQVNLSSQENDLVGIDVTKAISNLSQAVTANSAAMSAFAKVSQKTLLDYLG
jgi:flagellar hook-associated protein 3 FlgL